jgi:hypothetical protein
LSREGVTRACGLQRTIGDLGRKALIAYDLAAQGSRKTVWSPPAHFTTRPVMRASDLPTSIHSVRELRAALQRRKQALELARQGARESLGNLRKGPATDGYFLAKSSLALLANRLRKSLRIQPSHFRKFASDSGRFPVQ